MRALLPFTESRSQIGDRDSRIEHATFNLQSAMSNLQSPRPHHRVLIVDDEAGIRTFCALAMRADAVHCEEAMNGEEALEALEAGPFDLLLLDIDMPRLNGTETLKRVRQTPRLANLKVVMFSGRTAADDMAHLLVAGADDFLPKPFSITQLRARVKAQLRLKDAQDRSDLLHRHLLTVNAELERSLSAKDVDLFGMRNALILTVAKLVDLRSTESEGHLLRMQRYCRVLGEEAIRGNDFGPRVDANFVAMMEASSPLHDIGKVALPDSITAQPGQARHGTAAANANAHRGRGQRASEGGQGTRLRRRLFPNGRGHRPQSSRALGRFRLPGQPGRRGHPARRPGSSPSPTCTTPCGPGESTSRPCRITPP